MHIKTTVSYRFIPTRLAVSRQTDNNKCWEGCGEIGTFLRWWYGCRQCGHFEKQLDSQVKRNYYIIQQFHSQEDLEMNTYAHRKLVHRAPSVGDGNVLRSDRDVCTTRRIY